VSKLLDQMIHHSTLAEPGAKPFYLKATITDKDDAKSEFNGTVPYEAEITLDRASLLPLL
jgi:hypothetical protein